LYEKKILNTLFALASKDTDKFKLLGLDSLNNMLTRTSEAQNQGYSLQELCIKNVKESIFFSQIRGLMEHENIEIQEKALKLHQFCISTTNE